MSAPRPERFTATVRRRGVRTVRSASVAAARLLGRLVDPVPLAAWLVAGARDPGDAKQRATALVEAVGGPRPTEVVANYLQGSVLLGLPGRSDRPLQWRWDPERGVIDTESAHVSRTVRRGARRLGFDVRFDDDFAGVVEASRREEWTWITDEVKAVYVQLFELGLGSCVGVYDGGELVGGVWGLRLGRTFGAMSTFHLVDDAGSVALMAVADAIGPEGRWDLVDVGLVKPSSARFGAHAVPVEEFTARVLDGLRPRTIPEGGDRSHDRQEDHDHLPVAR